MVPYHLRLFNSIRIYLEFVNFANFFIYEFWAVYFLSYFPLAHTLFVRDVRYTSIYLFVVLSSLLLCMCDNWIIYTYLCLVVVLFLFSFCLNGMFFESNSTHLNFTFKWCKTLSRKLLQSKLVDVNVLIIKWNTVKRKTLSTSALKA